MAQASVPQWQINQLYKLGSQQALSGVDPSVMTGIDQAESSGQGGAINSSGYGGYFGLGGPESGGKGNYPGGQVTDAMLQDPGSTSFNQQAVISASSYASDLTATGGQIYPAEQAYQGGGSEGTNVFAQLGIPQTSQGPFPMLSGGSGSAPAGTGGATGGQSLGSVTLGGAGASLPIWGPAWAPWNWGTDAANETIKLVFPFVCIFFGIALVVVGLDMTFKGGMVPKLQLPQGFSPSKSSQAAAPSPSSSGDTDAAHAAGYQQGQAEVHRTQSTAGPRTGVAEREAMKHPGAADFAEDAAA